MKTVDLYTENMHIYKQVAGAKWGEFIYIH